LRIIDGPIGIGMRARANFSARFGRIAHDHMPQFKSLSRALEQEFSLFLQDPHDARSDHAAPEQCYSNRFCSHARHDTG
jgi:hypothetical protein